MWLLFFLFLPLDIEKSNVFGCETTIYKAVLYSVVHIEVMDIHRTKFYFFPANLDANNNFDTFNEYLTDLDGLFR